MSNKVTIQPTVFLNHGTNEKTFGVRVYDDYGQTYDNSWDSIPDDDMDILSKVAESDDDMISTMIDFIKENQKGILIGNQWYDWNEIKDII